MKINQEFPHRYFCLALLFLFTITVNSSIGQSLKNPILHYTFKPPSNDPTVVKDESGNNYNAMLFNSATVYSLGSINVADLGNQKGYISLDPSAEKLIGSLDNFTIALYIYIDESTDLSQNGNFIWNFARSNKIEDDKNGILFFSAKTTRYSVSKTYYNGAENVDCNSPLKKGIWQHVTYTQSGTTGSIYIDGQLVKSDKINLLPKDIGNTTCNYIGRSSYSSDAYLENTVLCDFRIYNNALNEEEIKALGILTDELNAATLQKKLKDLSNNLSIANSDTIRANLFLPLKIGKSTRISWGSNQPEIITNKGLVTRPKIGDKPKKVKITATISKENYSIKKEFHLIVMPHQDDKTAVNLDAENIQITENLSCLKSNITLPNKGIEGSTITWSTDKPNFLNPKGKLLKFAQKDAGKEKVKITATISRGKNKTSRSFDVYVAEDEGYSAYLFAYFTGNGPTEEAIHFAISSNGLNYYALNDNKPILNNKEISTTGGVRDPHILRGTNDNMFYMVVTDLHVSTDGWTNTAMVLLKSPNLTDWTHSKIDISKIYPEFSDVNRVWAPQTIYDPLAKKYMIYFSMKQPGGPDIIYYAYANKDFTALESAPKQLFYHPEENSCIDGDIIYKDGIYNMFFKTEGKGNGIKKAVSKKLTDGYVLLDKYLDQSNDAVEGSSVFKLINSDTWILMYDIYSAGKYQFTESKDLEHFQIIDSEVSMNFKPRHGTIIPITSKELEIIYKKWATSSFLQVSGSLAPEVKQLNLNQNLNSATIDVPLRSGTNFRSVDPQFATLPGVTIRPNGAQDFSKGAVEYTLSLQNGLNKKFQVSAAIRNNPVLDGYYADPEILYSHKTNKYYLYPTSDGFDNWSGTSFKTFSSTDLVNWTDEGVIIDLKTDVNWADRNAWAPTIIERKINGSYNYFYYFTAAQKIGVAVSNNPNRPFLDSGRPIVKNKPLGAKGGQEIDPDVFYDPQGSGYYLYWGNGYLACAKLNDDMISIDNSSLKIITPKSTFREGTEVFFRNGKYYFLWSENDTRDENYRVRYGMSSSPDNIEIIPENNLILQKISEKGIYGTGHNSVIEKEGTDEWFIVYHRFTHPKGIDMGGAAGFHREVCIDQLEFNEDGTIKPVTPTLEGIK